jgi:hypothetical protein
MYGKNLRIIFTPHLASHISAISIEWLAGIDHYTSHTYHTAHCTRIPVNGLLAILELMAFHTFTWDDHPTWQRVCTCLYGTHMSRIRKIRRIYIPMKSFVVSVLRMCISHMAAWKKISTQICNTCQSIRVDDKWFAHVGIGGGHECMCLWFTKCGEWFCYCEHYRHVIDNSVCVYFHGTQKSAVPM